MIDLMAKAEKRAMDWVVNNCDEVIYFMNGFGIIQYQLLYTIDGEEHVIICDERSLPAAVQRFIKTYG